MAAKTSWHRCGTKLRHCHLMYIGLSVVFVYLLLLQVNKDYQNDLQPVSVCLSEQQIKRLVSP